MSSNPVLKLPIHMAFTYKYKNRVRELKTIGSIINISNGQKFDSDKCIWDTGATNSVININTVATLGLIATGATISQGAHGSQEVNTYIVNIGLPNNLIAGGIQVMATDLGEHTDILIGMDIIGAGDMTLSHVDGGTQFSFCYPAFNEHHNLAEKAEKVNLKNHKKNSRK